MMVDKANMTCHRNKRRLPWPEHHGTTGSRLTRQVPGTRILRGERKAQSHQLTAGSACVQGRRNIHNCGAGPDLLCDWLASYTLFLAGSDSIGHVKRCWSCQRSSAIEEVLSAQCPIDLMDTVPSIPSAIRWRPSRGTLPGTTAGPASAFAVTVAVPVSTKSACY